MNPIPHRSVRRAFLVGVAALSLAACGSSSDDTAAAPAADAAAPASTAVAAPAAAASGPGAKSTTSAIGEILTDTNGLTLYGFTNDVDAVSTCYGTCADAWPPVIVPADFTVGPGLDVGIFATAPREDGQLQLVAGKFPLYTFAGDAVVGDLKGHGSGDVWFAVDVDGLLLPFDGEAPAAADGGEAAADADDAGEDAGEGGEAEAAAQNPVTIVDTDLGSVLADADGLSLYGFLDDADGNPTCNDACADAWPPLIVDGPDIPEGFDPAVFSVVERDDGSIQLKAGKWPLYRFAGDGAPGDTAGQGSGDVWFLAAPDGSLVNG